MTEFTVTITERPLGIRFAYFDATLIGVHTVKPNSIGSKLGLLCGDVLVSINGDSVLDIASPGILNLFNLQPCPFTATFERFAVNYESDSDGTCLTVSDDSAIIDYIHNISSTPNVELEALKNEMSAHYVESNTWNRFQDSTDSIIPKPMSNICLSWSNSDVLVPEVQQSAEINCDDDKFIYTNMSLYEYEDIDITTKDLVNGYIISKIKPDERTVDIPHILITQYLFNNTVMFDKRRRYDQSKVITTSSNGFFYGIHEWSIKLKCDENIHEFGVISNGDLDDINMEGTVKDTQGFGARAIYGNEDKAVYYASYSDNGANRCFKDLSKMNIHSNGFKTGDVVKVCLNLRKGYIRFWLNGQKVRKVISLQQNKMYYPFLSSSGNSKYELISYQ